MKYESIFNIISNKNNKNNINSSNKDVEYNMIDLLPKSEDNSMKNELKNFLKKQINNNNNNLSTEISDIDAIIGSINSYS